MGHYFLDTQYIYYSLTISQIQSSFVTIAILRSTEISINCSYLIVLYVQEVVTNFITYYIKWETTSWTDSAYTTRTGIS